MIPRNHADDSRNYIVDWRNHTDDLEMDALASGNRMGGMYYKYNRWWDCSETGDIILVKNNSFWQKCLFIKKKLYICNRINVFKILLL